MNRSERGKYVVFEGVAGCGKTTQVRLLLTDLRQKFTDREVVVTREPGGSEIADEVRRVVQGMDFNEEMDPVCEQYLYAASRAQTLRHVVRPVLENDGIVVADRSFFTSMAYQGYGRGLGVDRVLKINEEAIKGCWPDKVIIVDVDIGQSCSRMKDQKGDKFERLGHDFFEKVRKGYLEIAARYSEIVDVVDGNGTVEAVHQRISILTTKWLED